MRLRDVWPLSLFHRQIDRDLRLREPMSAVLAQARWARTFDAIPWPPQRSAYEFFAGGAGGAALGLHWAGVPVRAAVEADEARAEIHRRRWGVEVFGDIKLLAVTSFCGIPRPWLVWASPPCKGISEVNQKGKGVDDDGLFYEGIRLGDACRPDWLAFENVSRLRTRGADRVLERLERLGYAWWAFDLGSENAGKDHERRRIFIVARRKDAPDPQGREGGPAGQSWAPPGRAAARWFDVGRPGDRREGLGHLRAEALGRHVRAYDGVSDRASEFARKAYGDSVDPIFPFLLARALIAWEEGDRRTEQVTP